ncbi:MAG: TIGR00730 family Rossman fold protein [Pseudomonadota bacterium]
MSPPKSICVYCASSDGADPEYLRAAAALGEGLARAGFRLVYGGGNNGLMGAVARGALANSGAVLGIIPEFLVAKEQPGGPSDLTGATLVTVPDMHTRKQRMFEEADGFFALPGGIGTLEELVEIMTWAQLARHAKPVGLINIGGFWDPFVEMVARMETMGFLHNAKGAKPLLYDDVETAMAAFGARLS